MERVVGKLGYGREHTSAMLALYSYRVGSHYKSGKAPDSVDEAWAHMREVGRIIANPRLSGEEKIDFAIRNGTATDLEQVLTDDVPYSLVADMFSLYSHTDYLR
jgi:hypothetical protein